MVVAVYPGTFDPLTRGHEDLVRRASGLFDTLVVGVADSKNKKPFFSLEERLEIANEVLGHYPNVKVESFSGLLKEDGLVYVEAEYALPQGEDSPDWLLPWEQVRADKAGMVYYHLLKLKPNLHENKA